MEEPLRFGEMKMAAEELSAEEEKLHELLQEALDKAEKKKQKIRDFWDELILLIQMVRAYFKREYKEVPWKTIIYALAAIIYFLNPLDLIPDVFPALGFLDDATVVAFVLNAIQDDLAGFKSYLTNSISPT